MTNPDRLTNLGLALSVRVRDHDPDTVREALTVLDRDELERLALALAECVPIDQTKTALLAWKASPPAEVIRPLQPCGTTAAAQRHRTRGEELCPPCRDAERTRDRDRKRAQRRQAREAA